MTETVNCNLCGSNEKKYLYEKPDTRLWIDDIRYRLVECKKCGLAYIDNRPAIEEIGRYYPEYFYSKRSVEHENKRYKKEIELVEKYAQKGKILDIGCGGGGFLKLIEDKGWEAHGMDFYENSGNEYNLNIKYGALNNLNYKENYFDVITSWAVFEHLHNPMEYFNEVGRILKKGGKFICLVNNINSLWSRYAFEEDIPRHLYVFSKSTLKLYGEKAGLKLLKIDYSNNIFNAWSRNVLKNQALKRMGYDWNIIMSSMSKINIKQKIIAYPLLLAGKVIIPKWLESMLKIPGVIIGIFEKE